MLARLLEGKPLAGRIQESIARDIKENNLKCVLASIICSENAGALSYANSQAKLAQKLGIDYQLHKLPENSGQDELVSYIDRLNKDKSVNGIIVQMPLPVGIDYRLISSHIDAAKDAEGMNPANIGKILFGNASLLPCTPASCMELLKEAAADLEGKEVVIVGHSEIVGKPLALLLLKELATVTVCHIGTSKAGKLKEHVEKAQVLIVAVGKANLIPGEWIMPGAIVIDVGINRVEGKLVGDVEFEKAAEKASFITPVPGGVGPLTVTMLMRNLVNATKAQR